MCIADLAEVISVGEDLGNPIVCERNAETSAARQPWARTIRGSLEED